MITQVQSVQYGTTAMCLMYYSESLSYFNKAEKSVLIS